MEEALLKAAFDNPTDSAPWLVTDWRRLGLFDESVYGNMLVRGPGASTPAPSYTTNPG